MVCFCPDRKIIFLSSPRCASSSIDKILIDNYKFKQFTFIYDINSNIKNDPRIKIGIYKYIVLKLILMYAKDYFRKGN
jgi:hypothetical protein